MKKLLFIAILFLVAARLSPQGIGGKGGMGGKAGMGGGSSPSCSASDNFTRGNSSGLGANWTANLNNWNISANTAIAATGGVYNVVHWSACSFSNNQFSQMTVGSIAANQYLIPMVRVDASAASGYGCITDDGNVGTLNLFKMVAGTRTDLTSGSFSWSNGDVIETDAVGTTITCKRNGATLISTTDATFASGSAGMGGFFTGSSPSVTLFAGGGL